MKLLLLLAFIAISIFAYQQQRTIESLQEEISHHKAHVEELEAHLRAATRTASRPPPVNALAPPPAAGAPAAQTGRPASGDPSSWKSSLDAPAASSRGGHR